MSGENELKPCPFCGSHANRFKDPEPTERPFRVTCGNVVCYAETPPHRTMEEAEAQWNRRATPPGTELVPEGTMEAFAELFGCLPGRILTRDVGTCSKCGGTTASGMHKICYKCLREKANAILTRHRATQKETNNAQG